MNQMTMEHTINQLKQMNGAHDHRHQREGLDFITVPKEYAVEAITRLRDHEGFAHLVLLTAVDWLEQGQFQLTYLLNNPVKKQDLGIRVLIPRETPVMDSIHLLWGQAATYQRELHEMFGIDFPGSPRVDQPFILEGWDEMPPYRRDFDTKKYAEETYFPRPGRSSNDPTEYMKHQLYPDE